MRRLQVAGIGAPLAQRPLLLVRVDPNAEPPEIRLGAKNAEVLRVNQTLPACTRIRATRPAAVIAGAAVTPQELPLLVAAAEEVGADFLQLSPHIEGEAVRLWVESALARPSSRSSGIRAARHSKPEILFPKKTSFAVSAEGSRHSGWIVRLSVVGAEIETLQPAPAGADVVLWTELSREEGQITLHGRVQWTTAARFAVQFGPLGVRETRAIVRVESREGS